MFRFASLTSRIVFLHIVSVAVAAIFLPLLLLWLLNSEMNQPHREAMGHQQHVRRVVRGLEAAVQALQEATDPVVDVGAGLALGEAVEEVAVRVPVSLLKAYVVAVLPVSPVLLAQPGLLAHPYEVGVEMEGPQGLVGAAVRRDVHADPLAPEHLAQAFAGLLGLLPAALGQGEGVVGFTLIDGVINIAR